MLSLLTTELMYACMEWSRYIICRLFILLGVVCLFPTILVILLEPVVFLVRFVQDLLPSSHKTQAQTLQQQQQRRRAKSAGLPSTWALTEKDNAASEMVKDMDRPLMSTATDILNDAVGRRGGFTNIEGGGMPGITEVSVQG